MIVATSNKGKIREIKQIFNDEDIYSLKDLNANVEVEEDADTFYGNALKKAMTIYEIFQEPTLADDSGLCITALDGFPGVLTHRFLGENATDEERNEALIQKTNEVSDRSAQVVCVMVYYDGKNILVGEGIINGKIATERRGVNGFGFDDIFETENGKTLAELSPEEKNQVSARSIALQDLKDKLEKLNTPTPIKK